MNLDAELAQPIPGCDNVVLASALAGHGSSSDWLAAFEAMPDLAPSAVTLGDTVSIGAASDMTDTQRNTLANALKAFHPWRKGPFELFGVFIDTEWRSDWKWQRVSRHIESLTGKRVLDVGCGNGYFGWRMLAAGADLVIGIDPTQIYLMQHLTARAYIRRSHVNAPNYLLPVTLEAMPPLDGFDTVFSMGVLYHRRDPVEHLRTLKARSRAGGEVVVETLIVEHPPALYPRERYARMRNVHAVPDPATLARWFESAGFRDARIVDTNRTTTDEQRATAWMTFESLASALHPMDPSRTIEGHPAPLRATVIAHV